MDGTVYERNPGTATTTPVLRDFVKVDYALPTPIADILMKTITSHELFVYGSVFTIPINKIAVTHLQFVIPTRSTIPPN